MNYLIIYNNIIERSKNRKLDGYKERHHIIPKCMNGTNNKENIAKLTAREHFICHMLLRKIYPDNAKLKYALWRLINSKGKQGYKVTSKTYESIKITYSIMLSNKLKGTKFTKEHCKKISESNKGQISWLKDKHVDEKTKNKIRNTLIGHKMSEETCNKISESLKGNIPWNKGLITSEETKRKIRESKLKINKI